MYGASRTRRLPRPGGPSRRRPQSPREVPERTIASARRRARRANRAPPRRRGRGPLRSVGGSRRAVAAVLDEEDAQTASAKRPGEGRRRLDLVAVVVGVDDGPRPARTGSWIARPRRGPAQPVRARRNGGHRPSRRAATGEEKMARNGASSPRQRARSEDDNREPGEKATHQPRRMIGFQRARNRAVAGSPLAPSPGRVIWSVLAALVEFVHALLMAAWVVGIPLLLVRRWPRLRLASSAFAMASSSCRGCRSVSSASASSRRMGRRCGPARPPRACGRPRPRSGSPCAFAYAVFHLAPSHRAVTLVGEAS